MSEIVISPDNRRNGSYFAEILRYRELFYVLSARDIKIRYKQTVMGFAWAIVQPLMLMVVFTIFFGNLAKMPSENYPYHVYTFAALVPWTFFAGSVSASANALIGSAHLVSKVYFPRLIVPMAATGALVIDFLIATTILVAMILYYGMGLTANLMYFPLLMALTLVSAMGVGIFLSALSVAYRDVKYVVPFMIQLWLFCSPVVYSMEIVPEQWQKYMYLNPMAGVIEAFRSVFLGKQIDWNSIAVSASVSITMLIFAVAYFKRVERRFADII